jgi:hypothetical protein
LEGKVLVQGLETGNQKTVHKNVWRRRLLRIVMVLLLLLVGFTIYFIAAIHISPPEISDSSPVKLERVAEGKDFYRIKNNWLKKSESGLWEMYLEGDAFERGVINGKLTKELAERQETVFIDQIKELIPSEAYLNFLKYFVAYFNRHLPQNITEEYQQEIYGVSLSASDRYDRLAPKYYRILNYHSAHDIGHALQDKNMTVGCTSFGVWDHKTADGKLLLGRNFDFFAGDQFAENKIVCFTKPSKGFKYMYVTWAGFTGVVSGMNENGLTVTINAAKSDIPKSAATPISLLAKEILQYASNINEAYAISQKRRTFVSESILIGSARDHRSAIIEKTPTRNDLYEEKGDQLICANHFRGNLFKHDYDNNKNMIESSSLYRKVRMDQLLSETEKFTPEKMAGVLRDQKGLNGRDIGLTNEKGINQLLAHHSIIFKPEDLLVWVSTSPFQLGKYVCYDLGAIFRSAPGLESAKEITLGTAEIAADPFLFSQGYKDFVLFKKMRKYIEFCTRSEFDLTVEPQHLVAFVQSNPHSYLTYATLGDYFTKKHEFKKAAGAYSTALTKEVATEKEAAQIRKKLSKLNADVR